MKFFKTIVCSQKQLDISKEYPIYLLDPIGTKFPLKLHILYLNKVIPVIPALSLILKSLESKSKLNYCSSQIAKAIIIIQQVCQLVHFH